MLEKKRCLTVYIGIVIIFLRLLYGLELEIRNLYSFLYIYKNEIFFLLNENNSYNNMLFCVDKIDTKTYYLSISFLIVL